MRRISILLLLLALLAQCKKPEYQKQDIIVTGTSLPVISLNGTWKFTMTPPPDFHAGGITGPGWNDIKVPGECAMQGFAIKHNTPYVYKTSVDIPADYKGKLIILRFEGVYSYARVWVNGQYIRDHSGGFTAWDCDLTGRVIPGEEAWITVEITDRDDDLSYASGYAKHQIGGILRDVSLRALPVNFPEAIHTETEFGNRYRDAFLNISIVRRDGEDTWAGFRLYDRNGNQVRLTERQFRLKNDTSLFSFRIQNPHQWDAENPNLYTLIVEIFNNSILTASWKTRVGFREVRISENKLLVNGRIVRLRGACRHDIHPLLGRVSTPDFDRMDVLLAKEANLNFIRTSHYPPSESFLRYCDEYGLYVEDETAVCFQNTHRNRFYRDIRQSGPEFIPQMISQVEEMVSNHRNHPSVIIWSLGNESQYNEGFRMCYDYIKSVDKSRPVIFSYPGSVPDTVKCYDILSMHYPSWKGDLTQYGISVKGFGFEKMPVIFDEWAHVSCYNKPEMLEDMNVRNFWGISMDSMWHNLYSSGGTGGAIWCLTDETFMLPDTMSGYNDWWGINEETNGVKLFEGPVAGYGEWGIIDVWRRKKPEFWNTKKALSPVKILIENINEFRPGHQLKIPVHNRFSHTNLKDIKTICRYRKKNMLVLMQNIGPGEKGDLQLPPNDWKEGELINIRFLDRNSRLIDEYNLRLGRRITPEYPVKPGNATIREADIYNLEISLMAIKTSFNRNTGMIENLVIKGDTIIRSGPWLHFRYPEKDNWSVLRFREHNGRFIPGRFSYSSENGILKLDVSGKCGRLDLSYTISISGDGIFRTEWQAGDFAESDKAAELGLKFILGNNFDSLKWERRSYWNSYPAGHPGSGKGSARLSDHNRNSYRQRPPGQWELDNHSFYYDGLKTSQDLSYTAGSMKENIYSYTLQSPINNRLSILSDGSHACRIRKNEQGYVLFINSHWDYPGLKWGNYSKNIILSEKVSDRITMRVF